nr:RNA-directed DNA polymerase, eukaryota [Tanacetum cinerariifolium]
MRSYRSKEDEVLKISTSVFVANFPDLFGAKDLWNTCNNMGRSLMPIFLIEDRKQVNDLVLYALSRFQIEPLKRHSSLHNINGVKRGNSGDTYNSNRVKGAANSYAHVVKGSQNSKMDSDLSPLMVGSYEEVPNGEDVKNVEDLEGDSDGEIVHDTKFEEDFPNQKGKEDSVRQGNVQSEDPFNIYELLNHKIPVIDKNPNSKESLKYPPGYTSTGSHFKKSEVPKSGGSILQLIDDLVKVRETMGYDMKGMSVGNSGRILCVWDPNMFKKMISTVSDYFVMVRGDWMPNGEVVIMGDFNEVRNKSERFGTLFSRHGADVFNIFISNMRLEEVPLEGCSVTWCHRSATKMSKLDRFFISDSLVCSCLNISSITLDRYLSDHRPILMREVYYDYDPVPFQFFHYWFEVDGFDKFIEDSWKDAPIIESNALVRMMKKLKYLREKIRERENNVVNRRTEVVKLLQEVEKKNSLETAQNAKIKWAIEGDKNSKYYHGVINKKRNQLSIRGILVEGTWIDYPSLVKIQVADLECRVSKEEIKKAVWDCGIDKSPGPDGFTFGFIVGIGSLLKMML